MKFSDYCYQRPNLEKEIALGKHWLEKMKGAETFEQELEAIEKINAIRDSFVTMQTLCSVRSCIDTTDPFYEKEQEYFDENIPYFSAFEQEFFIVLCKSNFKEQLIQKFGETIFKQIEVNLKTFNEKIIPDLQVENKLRSEYSKLMASAKIEFDGKINNLSQMSPYMQSLNRETRKKASDLVADFLEEKSNAIDDIYDKMVKVRTKIAHTLGFSNFTELGYARLGRIDYDAKMVANYRKQVYEDVLPVVKKIIQKQAERLGISDMKSYDLGLSFLSGNPTPKGNKEYLVDKASTMYHEMSTQTGEFFDFMKEHELMDLEAKQGKEGGGFCTYLPDFQSPFIFSNFNGTSGDVDVLTHEAGHAFQVYSSRFVSLPDYRWPTLEACEIHSMSMEFFAWPWVHLFFQEDTEKYLYSHLANSIVFLPYGVCVDEFQHLVYENPEMTKEERKNAWRTCEKKYLPYKVYDHPTLEKGTWWYRQSHIFSEPFYYIDYTLAQVCAHQFWIKDHQNHETAWKDYYHLCCLGGSLPFLKLVEEANLQNPFSNGTIKKTISKLEQWLDSFDQSKIK